MTAVDRMTDRLSFREWRLAGPLLLGLLLLLATASARAEFEITVRGGEERAIPIAIVPFAGNQGGQVDIARVIADNFNRSGLFEALPRGDMLEKPSKPDDVSLRNWRTLGVEYVVIGELRANNVTRFHLIDVFKGERIMAYDMPAPRQEERLRYTAHDISDLVFEGITGNAGVFNTRIAYITSIGAGDDQRFSLMVSDADGYNPRTLVKSDEPIMSPAWSPDARKLAYVAYRAGRSSVRTIDVASGNEREVAREKGINGSPAWSPDGKKLAVTLSYEDNPDIYVIDLNSGNKNRLTTHWGIDTEASWSPDGKQIVFTSDRGGSPHIYRMRSDGQGDPERLTFEGRQNLAARYSPKGEELVLVHAPENGGYQIALFDLKRESLLPLTNGRLDESPSFAPNGQMVIYATRGAGGAELATVTTDARVRQNLRQTANVREPAWSPFLDPR
ncbi:Tol-Pal system beta propeller repeat protein TolB [Algiphilus aromaticivorans]|uniref:Tol-Pal system beta propeller repeat protein TolB n=1 Tax=Algiphilus aromaticivorans TaxID=382454 RepID=UPI000B1B6BD2|nr:Tol-Pal system beta propeller repeat protein TolB [Algiphilus aromaticivorans]